MAGIEASAPLTQVCGSHRVRLPPTTISLPAPTKPWNTGSWGGDLRPDLASATPVRTYGRQSVVAAGPQFCMAATGQADRVERPDGYRPEPAVEWGGCPRPHVRAPVRGAGQARYLPVVERLVPVILGSPRIPAAGGPANPAAGSGVPPAANQEGSDWRGPDPSPAAIARLPGDTHEPWALAGCRGHP
jgi:hypothetical protein